MLKQTLVSLLAVTSLTLSIQANAHQDNRHGVSRHHWHQPAPKPVPKFNINAAQARQAALINAGVKNRKLTRYEEKRLRDQQASIARLEHKLRHAGLNHWERKTLKQKLTASKHLIHSYLNNREYRKVRHNHRGHGGHGGHHNHGNNIIWKKHTNGGTFSISIGH